MVICAHFEYNTFSVRNNLIDIFSIVIYASYIQRENNVKL